MIFPVPENTDFDPTTAEPAVLPETLDETALVERVRRGDRSAFDEIDRRYRDKLRRFLLRQAADDQQAEEMAQLALVKAFLSIDSLRRSDRFGSWLYRIAFRLTQDEVRKPATMLLDIDRTMTLIDHRTEDPVRENPIDAENLWQTARNVLSADEYGAVWLKYVDGYKVASIAKIMGRTRISVRVLLFRARKKLLPALTRLKNR